jgi:hypothetical protein
MDIFHLLKWVIFTPGDLLNESRKVFAGIFGGRLRNTLRKSCYFFTGSIVPIPGNIKKKVLVVGRDVNARCGIPVPIGFVHQAFMHT